MKEEKTFPVLCWCEARVVKVSAEKLRECKTESCGAPRCKEAYAKNP